MPKLTTAPEETTMTPPASREQSNAPPGASTLDRLYDSLQGTSQTVPTTRHRTGTSTPQVRYQHTSCLVIFGFAAMDEIQTLFKDLGTFVIQARAARVKKRAIPYPEESAPKRRRTVNIRCEESEEAMHEKLKQLPGLSVSSDETTVQLVESYLATKTAQSLFQLQILNEIEKQEEAVGTLELEKWVEEE